MAWLAAPPGSHYSSPVALPWIPVPGVFVRSQSLLTCWQNTPLVSLETATLYGAGPDPQQQTAATREDRQFEEVLNRVELSEIQPTQLNWPEYGQGESFQIRNHHPVVDIEKLSLPEFVLADLPHHLYQ